MGNFGVPFEKVEKAFCESIESDILLLKYYKPYYIGGVQFSLHLVKMRCANGELCLHLGKKCPLNLIK